MAFLSAVAARFAHRFSSGGLSSLSSLGPRGEVIISSPGERRRRRRNVYKHHRLRRRLLLLLSSSSSRTSSVSNDHQRNYIIIYPWQKKKKKKKKKKREKTGRTDKKQQCPSPTGCCTTHIQTRNTKTAWHASKSQKKTEERRSVLIRLSFLGMDRSSKLKHDRS